MTSIAHHFDFSNMSILSHQPGHVTSNSADIAVTSSTLADYSHSSSTRRQPLLSISQLQPNHPPSPSSESSGSSAEYRPPQLCKPLLSAREKRRKVRIARSDSPSGAVSSTSVPTLRPRKLHSTQQLDIQHEDQIRFSDDDDLDYKSILPYSRLNVTSFTAPSTPPVIPDHIMIPKSDYSHLHTPLVDPAYEIPRETPQDTMTCIRTKINPNSVSISTQTPVHLSKTLKKFNRIRKSNVPSSPDIQPPSLEMKTSEEQEKWWYWCITCPSTSDANKSAYLTPLRCKDLKRNLDVYKDSQEPDFEIQTKPINYRFSLGQEKFHYPC